MVQFSPLEDNIKKKTNSNDLSSILNFHSIVTKHTDPQLGHQGQKNHKKSKGMFPINRSDSFSLTHNPCSYCLDNFSISSECSKAQENEVQQKGIKLDINVKNEMSSDHDLVTSENLSVINKDCAFDHPGGYSSSEKVYRATGECECYFVRHPENFKENKGREDLATRSDLSLCPDKAVSSVLKPNYKVSVTNVANIELGNAGVDGSLQNKATEEPIFPMTIPSLELKSHESCICTVTNMRISENVTLSEATESNIIKTALTAQVMISGYELTQIPQASSQSAQRKIIPPNVSQSINKFAQEENNHNQYNIKSNRTNFTTKAKECSKMSQDFIILGKSSIQHQSKIKSPNSHCLGLPHKVGLSGKFQQGHLQQERCHINQRRPKSPRQVPPSVSTHSCNSEEPNTPCPVRQGHSSLCLMDLKYSDMFKEISSAGQGPVIYEMFGTPVYSRELDSHESEHCRNVHSAPAGNAVKCKSKHFRGKRHSRTRDAPKKMGPVSLKNSLHIRWKKKDSGSKEKYEPEDSYAENGEQKDKDVTVSSVEGQMKAKGSTASIGKDADQKAGIATEFTQPAKQNELIPSSNLSPIEEVSLEYASDVDDVYINPTFAINVQEILWSEVKVHAEYAPFTVKSTNKHPNSGKSTSIRQEETEMTTCLMELKANNRACYEKHPEKPSALPFHDRMSPPSPQNLEYGNFSSEWACHLTDSVSQTYQNVLSNEDSEEITEDLFCCSVAKLLSFEGEDGSVSRVVMENVDVESGIWKSNGNHESKDDLAANVKRNKSLSADILEQGRENKCLDVSNFSENSLTNEDPILWTKGEILGKGAYGTVYCGLTDQGHLIAVKQVVLNNSDQAGNEKEYQKLQGEVEILRNLSHINIVGYLGTVLEDNIVSIFMEFVPGGSISSIIQRFGTLPETVFCKYTKQIVQGVAYLHENCVIHRDIKGNNVMLMPNGIIKLIDFGCAKRLACVSLTNTHSETLKSVHGTPYWMAPEIINESGYGRKSDIWSIGCTVFEMATGKPPLASMDRIAAMFYIGAHRGLMPSLPKHCSKEATVFVHLCLTRDQCERPTAQQLLQHPFLDEKTINVTKPL